MFPSVNSVPVKQVVPVSSEFSSSNVPVVESIIIQHQRVPMPTLFNNEELCQWYGEADNRLAFAYREGHVECDGTSKTQIALPAIDTECPPSLISPMKILGGERWPITIDFSNKASMLRVLGMREDQKLWTQVPPLDNDLKTLPKARILLAGPMLLQFLHAYFEKALMELKVSKEAQKSFLTSLPEELFLETRVVWDVCTSPQLDKIAHRGNQWLAQQRCTKAPYPDVSEKFVQFLKKDPQNAAAALVGSHCYHETGFVLDEGPTQYVEVPHCATEEKWKIVLSSFDGRRRSSDLMVEFDPIAGQLEFPTSITWDNLWSLFLRDCSLTVWDQFGNLHWWEQMKAYASGERSLSVGYRQRLVEAWLHSQQLSDFDKVSTLYGAFVSKEASIPRWLEISLLLNAITFLSDTVEVLPVEKLPLSCSEKDHPIQKYVCAALQKGVPSSTVTAMLTFITHVAVNLSDRGSVPNFELLYAEQETQFRVRINEQGYVWVPSNLVHAVRCLLKDSESVEIMENTLYRLLEQVVSTGGITFPESTIVRAPMRELAGNPKVIEATTLALLDHPSLVMRTLGCLLFLSYPAEEVPLEFISAVPVLLEFAATHSRIRPLMDCLERTLQNLPQWGILNKEFKLPIPKQNQNVTHWWLSVLANSPHPNIQQIALNLWKNEKLQPADIGLQLMACFSSCRPSVALDIQHSMLVQSICGIVSEQEMGESLHPDKNDLTDLFNYLAARKEFHRIHAILKKLQPLCDILPWILQAWVDAATATGKGYQSKIEALIKNMYGSGTIHDATGKVVSLWAQAQNTDSTTEIFISSLAERAKKVPDEAQCLSQHFSMLTRNARNPSVLTLALNKVSVLISADVKRSVLEKAIAAYLPKQPKPAQELLLHLLPLADAAAGLAPIRTIFNGYLESNLISDAYDFLDCPEIKNFLERYNETYTALRMQIITIPVKKPLPQGGTHLQACLDNGILLWPQKLVDAIQIYGHFLLQNEIMRETFQELLYTASDEQIPSYLSWLLTYKLVEVIPGKIAQVAFQAYLKSNKPLKAVEIYKKATDNTFFISDMCIECATQLIQKDEPKTCNEWLQVCSEQVAKSDMNPLCQLAYSKHNWSLLLNIMSRYSCSLPEVEQMILKIAQNCSELDTLAVLNLFKTYKITHESAWEALWKVAKPEHLQPIWTLFSAIEFDRIAEMHQMPQTVETLGLIIGLFHEKLFLSHSEDWLKESCIRLVNLLWEESLSVLDSARLADIACWGANTEYGFEASQLLLKTLDAFRFESCSKEDLRQLKDIATRVLTTLIKTDPLIVATEKESKPTCWSHPRLFSICHKQAVAHAIETRLTLDCQQVRYEGTTQAQKETIRQVINLLPYLPHANQENCVLEAFQVICNLTSEGAMLNGLIPDFGDLIEQPHLMGLRPKLDVCLNAAATKIYDLRNPLLTERSLGPFCFALEQIILTPSRTTIDTLLDNLLMIQYHYEELSFIQASEASLYYALEIAGSGLLSDFTPTTDFYPLLTQIDKVLTRECLRAKIRQKFLVSIMHRLEEMSIAIQNEQLSIRDLVSNIDILHRILIGIYVATHYEKFLESKACEVIKAWCDHLYPEGKDRNVNADKRSELTLLLVGVTDNVQVAPEELHSQCRVVEHLIQHLLKVNTADCVAHAIHLFEQNIGLFSHEPNAEDGMEEMLKAISERIVKPFPFCRVDTTLLCTRYIQALVRLQQDYPSYFEKYGEVSLQRSLDSLLQTSIHLSRIGWDCLEDLPHTHLAWTEMVSEIISRFHSTIDYGFQVKNLTTEDALIFLEQSVQFWKQAIKNNVHPELITKHFVNALSLCKPCHPLHEKIISEWIEFLPTVMHSENISALIPAAVMLAQESAETEGWIAKKEEHQE